MTDIATRYMRLVERRPEASPRPTMPHAATATDEEVEIERVAEVIHFAGTSHEPLVRKRGACPTEWRMLSDADYKDAVRISARAASDASKEGQDGK
jgi:hypothetical protein